MDLSYTGISYADAKRQILSGCRVASFNTLMYGPQYMCVLEPGVDLHLWVIADSSGCVRIEREAAERLISEGVIDPTKVKVAPGVTEDIFPAQSLYYSDSFPSVSH